MSGPETKYELLENQSRQRRLLRILQASSLVLLCLLSTVALYLTYAVLYKQNLNYSQSPSTFGSSFKILQGRAKHYADSRLDFVNKKVHDKFAKKDSRHATLSTNPQLDNNDFKLVCYYSVPPELSENNEKLTTDLFPEDIDAQLCTHINVGLVTIVNNSMVVDENLKKHLLTGIKELRKRNENLKILFWIGAGSFDYGFTDMVKTHKTRKTFIQSLKHNLETYFIDGVDLDWEFPSPYGKDKQHFSQLLHEIRREYQRERRTYLLSIAIPAPVQYQDVLYDIDVINQNVDFVNVMAYDFNMYSPSTPFTGLNAPLYPKPGLDMGIAKLLNINYTVYNLHSRGLERNKIIIGLPTYAHTFRLVNPFNHRIHSPSSGNGKVGLLGFSTYPDVCWFSLNNVFVNVVYDQETCSPYMYSSLEWISYDDERSLECKAKWIKENNFGGAMIFSLNADDFDNYCLSDDLDDDMVNQFKFPLTRKVQQTLLHSN